ncbi:MAG: metallophosphoesterase [Dorea sp.]
MLAKILILILIVLGIIIFLVFREIKRELSYFQTVHYEIESEKLGNLLEKKIVFLSDLHNHVYGKENEKLLNTIVKEKPDYIFVGGDMLVSNNKQGYLSALQFVKKLVTVCPVYYANGNHEQRLKERIEKYDLSYAAYRRTLEEEGIHFLENDSVVLELDDTKVRLTGLEIPLDCYKHFQRVKLQSQEIENVIGKCENKGYEILMAHNPSYAKEYVKWGADLVLSGHLHGGIVRLPFIGGMIAPNFHVFPKYSGDIYEDGDARIVVSKGLGTHTINIRLFNPAEVVVLHLKGKKLV